MILPQLIPNKVYYDFYKNVKGFKILDNGAAEDEHISTEDLLYMAWELEVDEVIAPDVYGEMSGTLHNLRRFMEAARGFKVMAVLHCATWEEFERILMSALDMGVASLALPRVMTKALGPDARLLGARRIRKWTYKSIHALGCTTRLEEAKDLAEQGIVRGIDSSAPVVLGLQGLDLSESYSASRPKDFFVQEETPEALLSLERFHAWCVA
jgi:hypothetical protein